MIMLVTTTVAVTITTTTTTDIIATTCASVSLIITAIGLYHHRRKIVQRHWEVCHNLGRHPCMRSAPRLTDFGLRGCEISALSLEGFCSIPMPGVPGIEGSWWRASAWRLSHKWGGCNNILQITPLRTTHEPPSRAVHLTSPLTLHVWSFEDGNDLQ